MGTNYYLIRKMKYAKNTPVSLGCDLYDNDIIELSNGWVLRNTYYPTLKELSENFTQEIHIGKSSFGWYFSLCVYPEFGINNLEDWIKLFNDPNNIILDEYDDEVSAEAMINCITKRGMKDWDDSPEKIKQFETSVLESQNSLMESLGNSKYLSYEEILAANHAERGVNGLWKHQRYDKFHIENPDKTATYDYIISGNDPETGCIFS